MSDEGNQVAETTSNQTMVEVAYIDRLFDVNEKMLVPSGTILLEALKKVGFMRGPCGGLGMCGRCVVEIVDGPLVQSCSYPVEHNIAIRKWRGR